MKSLQVILVSLVLGVGLAAVSQAVNEFKIAPSDLSSGKVFGSSVAIDGDFAIIGAPFDNEMGASSGAAYVFVRSGGRWIQQKKFLSISGTRLFGAAVAIDRDTIIVGTPWADDVNTNSGSVTIFVRSGSFWTEQAEFIASDAAQGKVFGTSVAIDGDTAIIGSPGDANYVGPTSGATYIFVRHGTTWTEQARLVASDSAEGLSFGRSVAISGNIAIIGANGAAYIFVRSGTRWEEQVKLIPRGASASSNFGRVVSIWRDTAIVGAPGVSGSGTTGAAYTFVRKGTSWVEQAKLIASDARPGDNFGTSVSIWGEVTVVGASIASIGGRNSGVAYIFVPGGNGWTEYTKFTASDAQRSDNFGVSVSIKGEAALVGSNQKMNSGAAYIYSNLSSPGTVPAAPTNLTATVASSTRLNLSWQDNADNETGFEIERGSDGTGFTRIVTVNANVTNFNDVDLQPDVNYIYRVRAINGSGSSAWSNQTNQSTLSGRPVVKINLIGSVVSATQIDLNWHVTSGNSPGFRIERKIENGNFTVIATARAEETHYRDTDLQPGVRYTYQISAINGVVNSGMSNQVTLTAIPLPSPPTRLTLTVVSNNQVDLSWKDNSDNESSFEIERKSENERFFTPIAASGKNVTRFSDTNLRPNTVYTYRVSAYNAAGNSERSNTVVFDPSLIGKPTFELVVPEGVGFIHIPLSVIAVNGQHQLLKTIGDLYDALGPGNVDFIVTYQPSAARWRSFFGNQNRGSLADARITEDMGLITMMRRPVVLRLQGDAWGSGGISRITLAPGINLVGVPLKDNRITRVSDLLVLEGIEGNATSIIVVDKGEFKVVSQTGDQGDIPITGGGAFIITAREAGIAKINGGAWDNVSDHDAIMAPIR